MFVGPGLIIGRNILCKKSNNVRFGFMTIQTVMNMFFLLSIILNIQVFLVLGGKKHKIFVKFSCRKFQNTYFIIQLSLEPRGAIPGDYVDLYLMFLTFYV